MEALQIKFKDANINKEARTISGVILAQAGEAKGHGLHIDESFLTDLVSLANKNHANGLKCNFGHNDNIGLQLGLIKNIRLDDGTPKGDLTIYESADNSPQFKNMGSWVLNMAEENKEALSLSIVFTAEYFYHIQEDGSHLRVADKWSADKDKPLFAKLGALHRCDVVGEGALTDSLFSKQNKPEAAPAGFMAKIGNLLGLTKATKVEQLESKIASMMQMHQDTVTQLQHLREDHGQAMSELAVLTQTNQEQAAKIKELEAIPMSSPTPIKYHPDPNLDKKSNLEIIQNDELNKKAQAAYDKRHRS